MSETRTALGGLIAALPSPEAAAGPDALARIADLAIESGVDGVCLAGATGEYPRLSGAARERMVRDVAARLPAGRRLLAGIGAASAASSIEIGRRVADAGAEALLLPAPGFFRYDPGDIEAFCLAVSDALAAPCLLYNLPMFTNGFETSSMVRLLEAGGRITGVKDSSGEGRRLPALVAARGTRPWTLLVGDDRLVTAGWSSGWNGAVSGIAACCPELLVALMRALERGDRERAAALQSLVDEIAGRLSVFPVPWGIRIALEARGYPTGELPFPLSAERRRQARDFTAWVPGFVDRVRGVCRAGGSSA